MLGRRLCLSRLIGKMQPQSGKDALFRSPFLAFCSCQLLRQRARSGEVDEDTLEVLIAALAERFPSVVGEMASNCVRAINLQPGSTVTLL